MNHFSTLSILPIILFVSACNDENNGSSENNGNPIATDYSYNISLENVISQNFMSRSYHEGFDLDNILVGLSSDKENIVLQNNTPRTIERPLIDINGKIYTLEIQMTPFSEVTFRTPIAIKNIKQASFVDTRPFFKAKVTKFVVDDEDLTNFIANVSEEQYERFVDEMLSQKYFSNIFDFNVYFMNYQNSKALDAITSISATNINDSSSNTAKLVNLRVHKPTAEYSILENDFAMGRGSIGDGLLAIKDSQLHSRTYTYPSSVYEHEKLHNHGFHHSGNMTYGWSDEFSKYIYRNGIDFYSPENYVENDNVVFKIDSHRLEKDTFMVTVKLGSKGNSPVSVREILIANDGNIAFEEAGTITSDGFRTKLEPIKEYDNMVSALWEVGGLLTSSPISDVNSKEQNGFYFIYKDDGSSSLSSANFIVSGISGNGNSINAVYTHPKYLGVIDNSKGYKQIVISKPVYTVTNEGLFYEKLAFFTPLEAKKTCLLNDLTLGELHPYKSQEMIDFQNKYLMYGSQVGLDATTKSAVAVSVPTSYNKSKISYVDQGQIIVCS
ncbi:hypothetical protein QXB69_004319 [Vibrio fluvialis]|nr:hypothetical protein [Vibrio fluvialis]